MRAVYPDAEVDVLPLADGGEGTVDALVRGCKGEFVTACVTGPLGDKISATYGIIFHDTAVIEMSAAAGITLSTVFQAVGKGIYSLIMSLCRQLVVLLPAAWLLSKISLNAIWWSFLIAEAVSLTTCLILFVRCDRQLLRPLEEKTKA